MAASSNATRIFLFVFFFIASYTLVTGGNFENENETHYYHDYKGYVHLQIARSQDFIFQQLIPSFSTNVQHKLTGIIQGVRIHLHAKYWNKLCLPPYSFAL